MAIISNFMSGIKDVLKSRRVLVVEDEPALCEAIVSILSEDGYVNVVTAGSVAEAVRVFSSRPADIAVLDVNLPDGDGFGLLGRLREVREVPALFLTARDTEEDLLRGFECGCDDYITKPFMPRELLARMLAVLRRTYREDTHQIVLDGIVVDFDTAEVIRDGERIRLTNKERDIIMALHGNANRIMTIDRLCECVWGDNLYGYENSLMAHIRRIREKIERNPSQPRFLVTVKGIGYKLNI